jgi:hypothetical protein
VVGFGAVVTVLRSLGIQSVKVAPVMALMTALRD